MLYKMMTGPGSVGAFSLEVTSTFAVINTVRLPDQSGS
jgi:hypothetical protein